MNIFHSSHIGEYEVQALNGDKQILLLAKPTDEYTLIIQSFFEKNPESKFVYKPKDSESRGFLPEILFVRTPDINPDEDFSIFPVKITPITIQCVARNSKQAALLIDTACFSLYVGFFTHLLSNLKKSIAISAHDKLTANLCTERYALKLNRKLPKSLDEDRNNEQSLINSIIYYGKALVDYELVDSFFGNISIRNQQNLYISKTGSALNDLSKNIVKLSIDKPSENDNIASSELPAHRAIYQKHDFQAILHGHPRFAVITSMLCDIEECIDRNACYTCCPYSRAINGTPIVSGEVGGGEYGLWHTVPIAINEGLTIVYGHGVFAASSSLSECFEKIHETEKNSFIICKSIINTM